jgi:hypothetical protein
MHQSLPIGPPDQVDGFRQRQSPAVPAVERLKGTFVQPDADFHRPVAALVEATAVTGLHDDVGSRLQHIFDLAKE